MKLQTKIPIQEQQPKIGYDSEIVLLGSCFAENIGDKLAYFKFKNSINPFGILFHPKAIETFLWMASQGERYTETDLFYVNEQWHCFDAHSALSGPDKNEVLASLNEALLLTKEELKSATHVAITLGTAWVYKLKALDMLVANCHKIPQREFVKELLAVKDIEQSLQNCIHLIRSINPSVHIMFTVSPVRHSKDGFVQNTRSKSHLVTGVHTVLDRNQNVSYFPAYEIMMDELRDYRFYDTDMIHPSVLAIEYIWDRFSKTWIEEKVYPIMRKVEEITRGLNHRAFNPNSKQHQDFLQQLQFKKQELQETYPFMDF
ncbi:GSCFA domain-containing protein [Aquimarina pacifica]|uniref:GSCFA domain-containing protein n=1 Tax=Aquimarina pacifica TaxID=1296415 RepID=UPI00046F3D2D|nr:GSCFA domain-containing protein [Aquimarina pacifica]